ncbi:MAG TPA: low molecular weight protein-tyrosine-phosphatase [Miltoncostaeaceae bacterium]|nr:low molecular weight protein-tyrosine-phosphatase [Miltoncostaeaceae bacterium]
MADSPHPPASAAGHAAPVAGGGGPVRVCFVCLGNICRSPTAAAVLAHLAAEQGVGDRLAIESAGTGDWHVGGPADPRAAAELRRRGVPLDHVARQILRDDLARHDLILGMDRQNLAALRAMADEATAARIMPLRAFDPEAGDDRDVPDPYHGGPDGFRDVFDMVQRSCRGLLDHLRAAGRL